MAVLSNGRPEPGYLAVELTVDKRMQESRPFSRGSVTSWEASAEMEEALAELTKELQLETPDWPPMDKSQVGWLTCTIKFVVGTAVIYQQGLLVQHYTFWEWYYTIRDLLAEEHEEERVVETGWESPELRLRLSRYAYDPDLLIDDDPESARYGCSLAAYVDAGVAAGVGVSGEGPGVFMYPSETAVLAFARALLDEAEQAG